ncbi:hypothetical protein FHW69_002123 [Luteibacter sp. Sphag1AF]|nr:hypothetical protein [Luteibacter sp. Sphag1AF]
MDRKRVRAICALSLCIGASLSHASPPTDPARMVEDFDAQVAARDSGARLRRPAAQPSDSSLRLVERLNSQVLLSDGRDATIWEVNDGGREGFAIRAGDTLSVSVAEEDGLHVTGYTRGSRRVDHNTIPNAPEQFMPEYKDDTVETGDQQGDQTDSQDGKPPEVRVAALVHDDVELSDEAILAAQFTRWIKHMETEVMPEGKVYVELRRRVAGVTDFTYGYDRALYDWRDAVTKILSPQEPFGYVRHLLLVNGKHVEPGAAGYAFLKGYSGMASVAYSSDVAAHEIGHMLGGVHERAAQREAGLLQSCVTTMWKEAGRRVPCYTYSVGNTALIREYHHLPPL